MTNADIIVNLAVIVAEQRLEISELKTEVEHLHHELLTMRVEADTPQTDCDKCIWNVCNYNKVEWDADTPQTDLLVKTPRKSRESHEKNCETCRDKDAYDEWQGNCDECENGSLYTPQTDCGWGEPNE